MKTSSILVASTLSLTCMASPADAQSFSLDFSGGVAAWQTVLDGVMGGLSTGRVTSTDPGVLAFSGELSLENNGGFSQMRRAVEPGALDGARGLVVECRGDGRTYKFDLRVSNVRMMAGSFQQDFETRAGEWTEVRLPFEGFKLYSFGRLVRNAPEIQPELIESIGVTLADKNAGEFRLEVRSIRSFGPVASDSPAGATDLASVAAAAGLTTLMTAVGAAGLELPKAPVTIFAPSDDAFAAIPAETLRELLEPESRDALRQILAHHVVLGAKNSAEVLNARSLPSIGGQPLVVDAAAGTVGGGEFAAVDVPFDGGIVHVVDRVLMPEQRSISEIAASDDRLTTLLAAVETAGLVGQLERQNGPWTVFAPVNSAFAKLPEGTVETLLEPENRRALTGILGLHVVPGRIAARELLAKKQLTSLMGQPVTAALRDGELTIGGTATLVAADIQAVNGVIHLIDTVLLPAEDPQPASEPVAAGPRRDLSGAVIALYSAAIDRGVDLFNDGHPEACVAVYEVAIEGMRLLGSRDLDPRIAERIAIAGEEADEAGSARSRAWALRRALDDIYGIAARSSASRDGLRARRVGLR